MKLQHLPAAVAGPSDTLPPNAGTQSQRRKICSNDLFSGRNEILIEHAGELYSLRKTSKGKLILTK